MNSEDRPTLMLYVTDLASLIGVHPYDSREETVLRIWKRACPHAFTRLESKLGLTPNTIRAMTLSSEMGLNVTDDMISSCTSVRTSIQAASEKIQESSLCPEDRDLLQAHVASSLRTGYGTRFERTAIQVYEQTYGVKVEVDPRFISQDYPGGYSIGGRIDGMNGTIVLEIKNRLHRFKDNEYDRIQCQAYIQLKDLREGHLVEGLDTEIKVTSIPRNDEYWRSIHDRIKVVVQKVWILLASEKIQESYLLYPDLRRTILDML